MSLHSIAQLCNLSVNKGMVVWMTGLDLLLCTALCSWLTTTCYGVCRVVCISSRAWRLWTRGSRLQCRSCCCCCCPNMGSRCAYWGCNPQHCPRLRPGYVLHWRVPWCDGCPHDWLEDSIFGTFTKGIALHSARDSQVNRLEVVLILRSNACNILIWGLCSTMC